ncbi:hypothetical protein [Mycobacterium sp. URHB0044]|jgi:hypothetical protein|uniref:hypothetical protein n=1 Tax=Mycobacterium sp. URHB0044 TaxID=1380386 RepID=UPI000564D0EA|nr:hypothetical protein [Mycobacterium sp. URHB0044]
MRGRRRGSYGVAKPSGVVAVTGGVANVVSGSVGAVVVVVVSPMVASLGATGPGGAGSAELLSLNATDTAPIASTAPAPTVADINFNLVDFTSDHSNSIARRSWVG